MPICALSFTKGLPEPWSIEFKDLQSQEMMMKVFPSSLLTGICVIEIRCASVFPGAQQGWFLFSFLFLLEEKSHVLKLPVFIRCLHCCVQRNLYFIFSSTLLISNFPHGGRLLWDFLRSSSWMQIWSCRFVLFFFPCRKVSVILLTRPPVQRLLWSSFLLLGFVCPLNCVGLGHCCQVCLISVSAC